jgi:hypothetical protein
VDVVSRLLPVGKGFLCKDCLEGAHEVYEREFQRQRVSPQVARDLARAISRQCEVEIDLGFRTLRGHCKGIKYQYLFGTLALTWLMFQDAEGGHQQINGAQIRSVILTGAEPEAAEEEAEQAAEGAPLADTQRAALERAFVGTRDSASFSESLEAYLVRLGLISDEHLARALADPRRKEDEPLGRLLVRLGYITGPQVKKVLELQYGIPYSDIRGIEIPVAVLNLLPEDVIRKYQVVPIRNQNGVVTVGMVDPRDRQALDEVRYQLQGMATDVRLISEHDFALVMETRFPLE